MNGQMDTETCWLNLCLEEQALSCLGFLEFTNVVLKFWGSVKFHVESVGPLLLLQSGPAVLPLIYSTLRHWLLSQLQSGPLPCLVSLLNGFCLTLFPSVSITKFKYVD